jgi:hypothetical protein
MKIEQPTGAGACGTSKQPSDGVPTGETILINQTMH